MIATEPTKGEAIPNHFLGVFLVGEFSFPKAQLTFDKKLLL